MRKQRLGIVVLGLAMIGGVTACNPVAVVTYRQFGSCSGAVNQSLVWFQFVTLDNSSGAASATFDPYASYVSGHQNDGPGLGYIDLGTTGQQAVFRGFPAAMKVTVAAGASLQLNEIGIAVLPVTLQEAATTPYALVGSGALADKLNASQTAWPLTPSCDAVDIKNGM